jgi:flagellar biosynthesis anti-sigma factor FlgM
MDGINSLQKMLGALQVNEPKNVGGASAVSATNTPKSPVTAAGAAALGSQDHASLSAAGGLAAASQATDNSDVRMDKVNQLQDAIASGTYNVPASAVADKMVESLLK